MDFSFVVTSNQPANWVEWLDKWQTLVTGAFALIGSALLWYQIRQGARSEKERNRKIDLASRATMVLVVSDLCAYAERVKVAVQELSSRVEGRSLRLKGIEFKAPPLPLGITQSVKDIIIETGSNIARDRFVNVSGFLQLLTVRVRGFEEASDERGISLMVANAVEEIINAASLYALSSSLLDYARTESDQIKEFNYAAVHEALRHLYFVDHVGFSEDHEGINFKTAKDVLTSRETRGESPYIHKMGGQKSSLFQRALLAMSHWLAIQATKA